MSEWRLIHLTAWILITRVYWTLDFPIQKFASECKEYAHKRSVKGVQQNAVQCDARASATGFPVRSFHRSGNSSPFPAKLLIPTFRDFYPADGHNPVRLRVCMMQPKPDVCGPYCLLQPASYHWYETGSPLYYKETIWKRVFSLLLKWTLLIAHVWRKSFPKYCKIHNNANLGALIIM